MLVQARWKLFRCSHYPVRLCCVPFGLRHAVLLEFGHHLGWSDSGLGKPAKVGGTSVGLGLGRVGLIGV